jgi:hypothetical protein
MNFRFARHFPKKNSQKRSIQIALALFGFLVLFLFLVPAGVAQNNNAPASSAGHSFSGGSPSFASSMPVSHAPAGSGITVSPHPPTGPIHTPGQPHQNPQPKPQPRSGAGGYVYPYVYAVPVPYAVDASTADADNDTSQDADAADDDANYQGGPTVFDRRGSGAASYIPPVGSEAVAAQPDAESAQPGASADASADAETIDPTILVFKDGHQIEVENYAVVSQTLYDLTPGHRRKIALAELDLLATEKLNDDRGVTFELPSAIQAN